MSLYRSGLCFAGLLVSAVFSFGSADRTSFSGSILPIPPATTGRPPRQGRLVRAQLTTEETAAPVHFEIALRMRHFAELQARLAKGATIPAAEMQARYLPLASDEAKVESWLRAQGFTIDRADADHLAVFARGSVAQAASALQVQFARVEVPSGEYTSAITAPSLPADVAAPVLGIHGLQPHLRHHRYYAGPMPRANSGSSGYLPSQIAAAYGDSGIGLTGAGQTIAIFGEAFPAQTDLMDFWEAAGVSDSMSNIQMVDVGAGPVSPSSDSTLEASLDVEWASSLAPGAVIRIYGANENDPADWDEEFQQVIADVTTDPGLNIHVFSISLGANEDETPRDYFAIQSQYIATLTAAGVTVLVASGDGGSRPDPSTGAYNPSSPLTPGTPADDPNATGVGGTSLTLSGSTVTSETAWSVTGNQSGGTGGGLSTIFARPSWQTGAGVPASGGRAEPDVAADGDPNTGAEIFDGGRSQVIGGTSLATPIWAAFVAQIDQARSNAGQGPLGQLNAKIYPLIGSNSFRDVTQGSNGTDGNYTAGPGYDLCTGIGAPNVAALEQALLTAGANGAPAIVLQPRSAVTAVQGQPATIYVTAFGASGLSYQWQRQASGTSGFVNLTDGGTYSGSSTAVLTLATTTAGMSGDEFQCVVTSGSTSLTTSAATLSVVAYGASTLAGWPGTEGAVNGQGWAARFNGANSIVSDSSGNLFVADVDNDVIREVTPSGAVSVFAGAFGQAGSKDGQGSAARFNDPAYLAIDANNNLYVADSGNYTIREITPGGLVTTIAGSAGVSGTVNGAALGGAEFSDPEAVAVDSAGNLYVADGAGNTIREISGGQVSTLAGSGRTGSTNGTGTQARFNDPTGIAVDASGNVYVSDTFNDTVRKVTSAGVVTTLAGTAGVTGSADGTGSAALFNVTAGLRVNTLGNLLVCDQVNGTIRQITPQGVVTTIAGVAGDIDNVDGLPAANGNPSKALFYEPADLTLSPSGVWYVIDIDNGDVRRLDLGAPAITAPPASTAATVGQGPATFTVSASSTASLPFSYQWQAEAPGSTTWTSLSDGGAYAGTATADLVVTPASIALDQTQYRCLVSDAAGSATSPSATLSVSGPPIVLTSSPGGNVVAGASATLSVTVQGSGLSYQWSFASAPIAGATGSSYTISNFQASSAGTYTVTATDAEGQASQSFTLSVSTARLINLSARAFVSQTTPLIAGFVASGPTSETLLIRADGPALSSFDVSSVLATPELTLYDSASTPNVIATNIGWGNPSTQGSSPVQTTISPATNDLFNALGAFDLQGPPIDPSYSADCAMVAALPDGAYTAQVSGVGGTSGNALAELYDTNTAGTGTNRLANISARAGVTPDNPLVAGFSIAGSGSEQILIRGVGPGLTSFGVGGVLATPILTLYDNTGTIIATNVGWGNAPVAGTSPVSVTILPATAAVFTQVGAFGLTAGSADSAMVVTLPPRTYTAQVTGPGTASGNALVEIYEILQ